jgi:endogenous inhibitor of DNA gyrase (YacG/DUF329 family)
MNAQLNGKKNGHASGHLHCAECGARFTPEEANHGAIWEQICEENPWMDLGDGATLEDRLFARLDHEGGIPCPQCGTPVELTEQSLSQLSLHVLGQW